MHGLKQIGTICFAIFSFVFSAPTFAADIPSSASTADCKNNPLQTYSGTSNLQADWQANTIQLHWYNGDDELTVASASQSCIYDGTLTPPATIPTKTGYTFKGWRVRPPQTCGIESLETGTPGISSGYKNDSAGPRGAMSNNVSLFGLTSDNTWAARYSYGVVYGMARCSSTSGNKNNGEYGEPSTNWLKTTSEDLGQYCWCKVTGFTPTADSYTSGPTCNVSGEKWVFFIKHASTDDCRYNCALYCAYNTYMGNPIQIALFSTVGQ